MLSAVSAPVTIALTFVRETPNMVLFKEAVADGDTAVLRNIYLEKSEYARLGSPQMVEVTIAAA